MGSTGVVMSSRKDATSDRGANEIGRQEVPDT